MEIKIIRDGYKLVKKTMNSNGYDLVSGERQVVEPGERKLLKTGVVITGGWSNTFLQLHLRSSTWKIPVELANGTGIIDSDYRDEIRIPIVNKGTEQFILEEGEAVAQLLCIPSHDITGEVEVLDQTRDGGFGSTGK